MAEEEKEEQEEEQEEEPRLHVDEDWKKAVREEQERLRESETEQSRQQGRRGGRRELPEPSIPVFMAGLYTQTLMALGAIESPAGGGKEQSLQEAEYLIDTIAMLKEKTRGNLDDDEEAYVQNVLTDLRMRYVGATGKKEDESEEAASEDQD
ncbi:MAG: DUF1844 domain-containing protein [Candidatus Brocadiaceae bacterium]|jgi:hypothetical protein